MIKVTIIVPTFGKPDKLERTFNSIASQSMAKDIQLIIVDDNNPNTDARLETKLLVNSFNTDCLNTFSYLEHTQNSERSAARNTGIKNAKGKYIVFLDSDDYIFDRKIEKQYLAMESSDAEYGVSYTNYQRISNGEIVKVSSEKSSGYQLVNGLARNLFIHPGSNLMVRADILDEVGTFNESISYNEDFELLVRILKKYKLLHVDYMGLTVDVTPVSKYSNQPDYYSMAKAYQDITRDLFLTLSDDDQSKVLKLIGLQLIYQMIKTKKYLTVFRIKKEYGIGINELVKYLRFITVRKKSGASYGFEI